MSFVNKKFETSTTIKTPSLSFSETQMYDSCLYRFQELKRSKEVEAASWVQRMATMNMAHERALQVLRIGHSLCAVLFTLHSKIGNSQVCSVSDIECNRSL